MSIVLPEIWKTVELGELGEEDETGEVEHPLEEAGPQSPLDIFQRKDKKFYPA